MRKFQARAVKMEMKRMGQFDSAQLTLTVELASVQREDKWSMVLDVTRVVKTWRNLVFPLGKKCGLKEGGHRSQEKIFHFGYTDSKGVPETCGSKI